MVVITLLCNVDYINNKLKGGIFYEEKQNDKKNNFRGGCDDTACRCDYGCGYKKDRPPNRFCNHRHRNTIS